MKTFTVPAGWVAVAVLLCGTAGSASAGPLRAAAAPVPPTQEIEVLDPGVDPTGKPATMLRPDGAGGQLLDVPPAVLVHKFFYTGNRSFQAQILPGGPVIVSGNHPKTGERFYVPVTLPPGAPRVFYTADAIRYDYGPQSVRLSFGLCGKPVVHYSQGTQVGERARGATAAAMTGARNWVQRTGIPQGVRRLGQETKEVVGATADRINDAGRAVVTPVAGVLRNLPGAQLLRSSAEDQAARAQERLQREADRLPPRPDQTYIPRIP